jgi:hypothetical protein
VDGTGESIQLLGETDEDREKELAAIRAALVNSKVAGNLYVNAVTDKQGTRYFVGIRGDASDFAKAGFLEGGLAEVIGSTDIVQFGFGQTVTEKRTFMQKVFGSAE